MSRFVVGLACALLLAVLAASPVAAHGSHRSCAAFGALSASFDGDLGTLVSLFAPTGPQVVSSLVLWEHAIYC